MSLLCFLLVPPCLWSPPFIVKTHGREYIRHIITHNAVVLSSRCYIRSTLSVLVFVLFLIYNAVISCTRGVTPAAPGITRFDTEKGQRALYRSDLLDGRERILPKGARTIDTLMLTYFWSLRVIFQRTFEFSMWLLIKRS